MRERTVAITRRFDAPRERVFEAWTRAEHLTHWFGPTGFSVHSAAVAARPGGVLRLCVRSPDVKDYWVRGQYRELAAPEHLVITCTADDDKGVARLEEVIEVSFTRQKGTTEVRLRATARGLNAEAAAMLERMDAVWAQTFMRLDAHVKPAS